jgi:hypothetical protein
MGPYVKLMEGLGSSREAPEHIRWKTAAELFKIDVKAIERT